METMIARNDSSIYAETVLELRAMVQKLYDFDRSLLGKLDAEAERAESGGSSSSSSSSSFSNGGERTASSSSDKNATKEGNGDGGGPSEMLNHGTHTRTRDHFHSASMSESSTSSKHDSSEEDGVINKVTPSPTTAKKMESARSSRKSFGSAIVEEDDAVQKSSLMLDGDGNNGINRDSPIHKAALPTLANVTIQTGSEDVHVSDEEDRREQRQDIFSVIASRERKGKSNEGISENPELCVAEVLERAVAERSSDEG